MSSTPGITLTAAGITVDGQYFTLVNGYQSGRQGQLHIEYKDLLAVERVRRRSKKMMFLFVGVGSLIVAAIYGIDALINIIFSDPVSAVKTGFRIARVFNVTGILNTIAAVFTGVVILAAGCLLAFAFSNRAYIELTFIGGAVRVPCASMSKADAMRLVADIQQQKGQRRPGQ